MLGRIINDELQLDLPESGVRLDGRTVSGYNLLPIDELKAEGWKEVIKDYSAGSEYISSFSDNGENIVLIYSGNG